MLYNFNTQNRSRVFYFVVMTKFLFIYLISKHILIYLKFFITNKKPLQDWYPVKTFSVLLPFQSAGADSLYYVPLENKEQENRGN